MPGVDGHGHHIASEYGPDDTHAPASCAACDKLKVCDWQNRAGTQGCYRLAEQDERCASQGESPNAAALDFVLDTRSRIEMWKREEGRSPAQAVRLLDVISTDAWKVNVVSPLPQERSTNSASTPCQYWRTGLQDSCRVHGCHHPACQEWLARL